MSQLLPTAGERFGTVVRVRRAGDFVIRLSHYRPDIRVAEHHHPLAYFSYVVSGELAEHARGSDGHFERGSLHFHAAQEPHEVEVGASGLTCLSITPAENMARRASLERADARAATTLAALAARCHRAFLEDDEAAELHLEASALDLVAAFMRSGSRRRARVRPRWLDDVRAHLQREFARPLALAQVAARAGVHPVHMVRAFHRHEGVTPGAFLRRCRLEAARRELSASDRPIAELALACGFASQSHLTRLFRREFGVTPAAYRRSQRY